MRAHWFQHVSFEGLGCIEPWLLQAGYEVTSTRFYETPVRRGMGVCAGCALRVRWSRVVEGVHPAPCLRRVWSLPPGIVVGEASPSLGRGARQVAGLSGSGDGGVRSFLFRYSLINSSS